MKKPKPNKLGDYDKKRLRRLANNTMLTQEEISNALGVNQSTVKYWLHKMDISTAGRKIPLKKMAKILKLALNGSTKKRIMNKLHTAGRTISRVVDFYNIDTDWSRGGWGWSTTEPMERFNISDETKRIVEQLCDKVPDEKHNLIKKKTLKKIREYAEEKEYKIQHIREDQRKKVAKAAFLLVCKNEGINVGDVEKGRKYRQLSLRVGKVKPQKPSDVCEKIFKSLDLSSELHQRAMEVANILDRYPMVYNGKSLKAFAGACVYYVSQDSPTEYTYESLSQKTDTSSITISKRVQDIEKLLEAVDHNGTKGE